MKAFVACMGFIAVSTLAPVSVQAQSDTIIGGYASIILNPTFIDRLSASGINITDLASNALQDGANNLPSLEGVIDLQNGNGGLIFSGGYQIVFQGTTVRVQDITFNISGPNATFSGLFTAGGKVLGRRDLFFVNQKPNFSLPLRVQSGTVSLPQLSLGLAPDFVRALNQAAGHTIIAADMQAGTASAFPLVVPDTTPQCK